MTFDPKKPHNNLPLLPPAVDLDTVPILKRLNLANVALARMDGQVSAAFRNFSNALLLIRHFTTPEAVDSSKVENIITTTREVFEAQASAPRDRTPAQKETLRYVDALERGHRLVLEQGYLSTNNYIAIQKILEPSKSGIRKLPGTQIRNEKTHEIYYTPPEGDHVIRGLLKNYEENFNTKPELDPLIMMAILHYQFEAIHPFIDGNGRTGRMLMPLYLSVQDRLAYPVLFLSEYIFKHRDEYYQRLRAVTREGAWMDWVMYILTAVEVQATRTAEYLDAVTGLTSDAKVKMMQELPKLHASEVVDYVYANPIFNREQYAQNMRVHINTAARHLAMLVENGFLEVYPHKTSKLYYNPDLLAELDRFKAQF